MRYYIDGVNIFLLTSILGDIIERKEKIIQWRKAVGEQMGLTTYQ